MLEFISEIILGVSATFLIFYVSALLSTWNGCYWARMILHLPFELEDDLSPYGPYAIYSCGNYEVTVCTDLTYFQGYGGCIFTNYPWSMVHPRTTAALQEKFKFYFERDNIKHGKSF